MWPFHRKQTLVQRGILQGFTDWHSHLLPGVDDGVQTLDESLRILAEYERLGVRAVWLTPHVMEDIPNTPQLLRERFQALQSVYDGKVQLHLAAEHMLDNLFEERLAAGEVLPLGDNRHLLVETSYYNPPLHLYDLLRHIQARGYHPVLAHPERYRYMEIRDYHRLKDMHIHLQVNLLSLIDGYGKQVARRAHWLLRHPGYVNLLGSDIHSLANWHYLKNGNCRAFLLPTNQL